MSLIINSCKGYKISFYCPPAQNSIFKTICLYLYYSICRLKLSVLKVRLLAEAYFSSRNATMTAMADLKKLSNLLGISAFAGADARWRDYQVCNMYTADKKAPPKMAGRIEGEHHNVQISFPLMARE